MDELDDIGGLSGHSIGLISIVVFGGIVAAISALFFGWRPSHREIVEFVAGFIAFAVWGYASERAEKKERRLKRIELKLDKALDLLRDRR